VAALTWLMWPDAPDVPSVEVSRQAFVDTVQVRGEIKAGRSITLTAPADAGELRIVRLVRSGTPVKKGDVIVTFDPSTVARTVEEKQSEVRGLDAEIEKVRVQGRTRHEEHVTAETKARYDVDRASLDYSAREILSRVEAEQRRLAVLDAGHKLREATAQLESGRTGARADLVAASQKRDKATFDLEKARRQQQALTLAAPTDGIITVLPNFRAGGFGNQQDFKEGDRAWPGAGIAELPDVSSTFGAAKIDEVERGRLAAGQTATIRVEALPDRELRGHVQSISAIAKADFSSWPPPRSFDLHVALDETDPRLRPGMSASIRVAVERLADALVVPSEAVFTESGEQVVYVVARGALARRTIRIDRRSPEQVVVRDGLAAGERVSLRPPAGGGQ
jgi:RND family efflux transporter MFP subunit